ncbi:MAG: sulfatase-like hydrolase/transferase [Treponema sp.]|nr:sulfatase-like hydrolase/transferase [Treponema sp.]
MSFQNKPNVLWICTDHQRYDTLGCYGNTFVNTPNLDHLAGEGVQFNYAYSQSPVCSPSRASFLTGRYPRTTRCRQNGQVIPRDEKLITKIFADNGYNCGLSGKLHLAPANASVCRTTEQRIDDGYSVFHWSTHPMDFNSAEQGWANNEYHVWLRRNKQVYKPVPYNGSRQVSTGMPEEFHQTTWCVDRAVDFIQANAIHKNPWFFSINIFDPHHPFDPPKEYLERYTDRLNEIPLPNYIPGELDNKSIYQQLEHKNGGYNRQKEFIYDSMSETDHRLVRAAFWAMIDLIDHQVGRLLNELEQCGELDNTIIIFTSDHGEMLGDHGVYLKGPHFYDCCVRVPLIISWKNHITANAKSDALVELTDIAPALLEAAAMEKEPGMQGKSLWSLLCGKAPLNYHRDDIYSEFLHAMPWHRDPKAYMTMLRDRQYKIISDHLHDGGELYDLQNDPNETHNLWDDPAYNAVRFRMLKRLCDRIALTCDPLPPRLADY